MVVLCALVALPASADAGTRCLFADADPDVVGYPVAARAVACLVNERRADHGLPALRWNAKLADSATGQAARMVRERFFGHVTPEGGRLVDRLRAVGWVPATRRWTAGENLAWAEDDRDRASVVVERWMKSPRHRAIVLSHAREAGVGVVVGLPFRSRFAGATYVLHAGERLSR